MYSKMLKESLEQGYEEIEEIAEEVFEHLKKEDECKFWKIYFKMYETTYGKMLNEEMAEKWVHSMKPYGEHWTKEQTDAVLEKHGLTVDKIEFYAIMNMVYNDYNKAIETDNMTEEEKLNAYIKLAYYFIKDEDFGPNKVYEYYKTIVFNNIKRA